MNKEGKVEEVGEEIDFIASPVEPFFRTGSRSEKFSELNFDGNFAGFSDRIICSKNEKERIIKEFNGDANGAYNIARKGIMILDRIIKDPKKTDLFISKYQWDNFVQK